MTDKELLEMAAKAAGIEVYESTDGTIQTRPVLVFSAGGGMGTLPYEERWNPLSDDAQAFRLAVKLGIDVFPWQNKAHDQRTIGIEAATRLAIVRAAAEIGKNMETKP